MTIKIQCSCGAKYSFDVEPENGRMPFVVNCPSCQASGTEAANKIIAESATPVSAPKLRVSAVQAPAAPAPAPVAAVEPGLTHACSKHPQNEAVQQCTVCQKPICLECMAMFGYLCSINCRYQAEQRGIAVPKYKFQKTSVEKREFRKAAWITIAVCIVLLLGFGAWIWVGGIGSHPRLADTIHLTESAHVQFFAPGKMLVLNAKHAALYDLKAKKDLWSTAFTASEEFGPTPEFYIDKSDLWVCLGQKVVCVNTDNGELTKTVPIPDQFISFTPAQSSLLVVSAADETRRTATRIELPSGEVKTREIVVPHSEKKTLPNDLPANVAPTAGVLLKQMEEDKKFNRTLTTVSSEFFPAGENLIELRTTLIEPKVTAVQTMKPKGPTHINGNTTASTSAGAVFEEVFNDIKRSNTGGFRNVDESHYQILLRRWTGEPQPLEWKGDVSGLPNFYSLPTVDLLVAGKLLIVFDKQNKKLFESKLSYPVSELYSTYNFDHRLVPAVQTESVLYFYDQGVMTAFDLPSGNVRWRLTSIGIGRAQFDPSGALYIDSTSASPDEIQYPDQISLDKISPIILKVDSSSGKILWQAQKHGQQCFISGKFLYATSTDMGGIGLANALSEALETRRETTTYFHVYRLDTENGNVMWDYQPTDTPDSISFQKNQFLLGTGKEIQLMKFISF